MRTTLDLDERLVRAAKRRAVEDGKTLTRVIEESLRIYLEPARPAEPFRLELLIKHSRVVPGVDLSDRDSLYERMEGRS